MYVKYIPTGPTKELFPYISNKAFLENKTIAAQPRPPCTHAALRKPHGQDPAAQAVPAPSLGVSRLRLGVQSQPDHLESPGSKGKGRIPRARSCDPSHVGTPHHSAPRIGSIPRAGIQPCPQGSSCQSLSPAGHTWDCCEQTHGAGGILFCFHQTGNVQQNSFYI